jgi:DNA-3-methyladenine glycosylase II
MMFTKTFTLNPTAPLDFELTAQVFSSGDKQIRAYTNSMFHQVLRLNGNLVLIEIASSGTVEKPKLTVALKSNVPMAAQDKKTAEETVKFIFNLGFDLCSFYNDVEKEPVMHSIPRKLYGLKNPTTSTVFELLVDSIVEQQISIKVAHTIEYRLAKKFGETLTLESKTYLPIQHPKRSQTRISAKSSRLD